MASASSWASLVMAHTPVRAGAVSKRTFVIPWLVAARRVYTRRVEGTEEEGVLRLASARGRWVVAASVLGSGAVFLESTVVNVALPSIGRTLGLGISGLQWVLDGYLLTLSALMLLGGALGDVLGRRRMFTIGAVGFGLFSGLAGLAPTAPLLVAARLAQGLAGALLVPNSLALLTSAFSGEERGTAIGRWAGWSGVWTALGPFAGGLVVDAFSYRWVFASVVPPALAAGFIGWRAIPADRQPRGGAALRSIDYGGAVLVTLGLAGVLVALIAAPDVGATSPLVLGAGGVGVIALIAFFPVERRAARPLLPLSTFRSLQFTGANVATLFVYAALSGLLFLLMLVLQNALGYDALAAGLALLPINVLMLLLSPLAGRIGQRFGPRGPMTVGCLVVGLGLLWLSRVRPGVSYLGTVMPALCVFGLGLASLVAPLTDAVLGAVPTSQAGVASGVNNAVARLAGLLAVALLPLAAGLGGLEQIAGPRLVDGYARAALLSAALCGLGAIVSFFTIGRVAGVPAHVHPSPAQSCMPPE